jgi:cell division protein FtsI (penicillin-binding protein 3)
MPRRPISTRRAGIPRRRLVAVLVIVVLLFAVLAFRTAQLQTLEPERFVEISTEQTVRTQTLAADRGSIYDRNGYELALSIPLRTIYTDPKFVSDPAAEATALAPILDLPAADLEQTLAADNRFGYLARQVADDVADRVEALDLDGVYFIEEPHRFTPSGDLARSLLGLTDVDNKGLGGLELQYNSLLAGTPGELTYEQDPEGRTIAGGEHHLVPPEAGGGLVLTLDRALQYEAEQVLADHVARNGAESGSLVAMKPDTGEILAMANVDVDADTGETRVSSNNLALTTVFEPGSVMKIVGMSGGIEDGVVSPTGECINAPDTITVAGSTFSEFHPHGDGCWPAEDVLVNSSNTGSITIAQRLGSDRLYHYFRAFGFGDSTGLGFPNELGGYVRPVEDWWGTSIASMPIGQGISVTPLQMLLAYNTIANGGVFVPAQLVRATVDGEGNEHLTTAGEHRRVISDGTAAAVGQMLTEVVTRGTAQDAQVDGFYPAGKTGTAQIPAPDGGYEFPDGTKHYVSTFCGFLPADNPQLSVCVVLQHPTAGAYTGGAVAAPAFADFGEFAVAHLHITPSELELSPEDLGLGTVSVARPAETPYYAGLGPAPDGQVRAEPTRPPEAESGDGEAAGDGATDATGAAPPGATTLSG